MGRRQLTNKIQSAFTGGEFSPALQSRGDFSKYASGAKTLKNVFVFVILFQI